MVISGLEGKRDNEVGKLRRQFRYRVRYEGLAVISVSEGGVGY
jgi:hypothetical protein